MTEERIQSSQPWIPGRRFLLPLTTKAHALTEKGEVEIDISGEAILQAVGDASKPGLKLERLALAGSPIQLDGASSGGKLAFLGEPSESGLTFNAAGAAALDLEIPTRIHYPELDPPRSDDPHPGCYRLPTFLPASIRLISEFVTVDNGLEARDLRLTLSCAAGRGEILRSLFLDLPRVATERLLPLPDSPAFFLSDSNDDCDPTLQVNRRRLILQPVGFRTSAADANPSGSTAPAQFATAQNVWDKCCIDLEVRDIILIDNATLKTSGNPTAIRAAYTDAGPNVIEVFFVQNPLNCCGGGTAEFIGVPSQKLVIAEPNAGNPVLLAHEIGHALGLTHPGGNSDSGTVMAPTGSPNIPGTELVTHFMCQNISQPALQTLASTCCLTHDIGDHFIRDFPEDIGQEPSDPLPAGRTRYSMSNVWNRNTNTPGTFGANGPAHQQPFRFENDGVTPKTNYLFARVEQRENLKVRDAVVRFYMKHPGSGSGALNFLGQVNVPNTLGPASPQNVSIAWQVPGGTPNHSCVFAVVASPAEPEGDQSGLNWAAFEALSRQDNDWAQRNLNVRESAPNLGSGNVLTSAPFIIRIPLQEQEALPFTLNLDARQATRLEALNVEIPGGESFALTPGKALSVQPKQRLQPGEEVPLLVHAQLPGGTEVGDSFVVNVDPVVAETPLAGYACEFQIAPPDRVAARCLDDLLTAFDDLTRAIESSAAYRLLRAARRLVAEGPWSLEELAQKAYELFQEDVLAIAKALNSLPEGNRYGLAQAIERWISEKTGDSSASLEAFCDLLRRLQIIAYRLLETPLGTRPGIRVHLEQLHYTFQEPCPWPYRELRFFATAEDARGRVQTLKLPATHYYRFDRKAREVKIERSDLLYFGDPQGQLKIQIEARELDGRGRESAIGHYDRTLSGNNDQLKGFYKPGDERPDPEKAGALRVFYRVE